MSDGALPTLAAGPAPGSPLVALANQATRLHGLLLNSQWGEGIAVSDGSAGPRLLEVAFETRPGNFEIWIEFAAAESRPVSLLVDGLPIMEGAAATTTMGWFPPNQLWRRQISLSLEDGRHTVGLSRDGAFPHVRRIALLPVEGRLEPEQDSIALERRIGRRAAALEQTEFEDLARAAVPVLRRLYAYRRSQQAVMIALAELTKAVAQDVAAPQDRLGFSGPFNGQRQRQLLFNRLDAALSFDVFVETGAYLGTTTEMLAGLGRPVYSCEPYRELYLRSLVRLCSHPSVFLYNMESRTFLLEIFHTQPRWKMPFFYLDAHWANDWPLPDEIGLIAENLSNFVIFVDDFQHPDPEYGYDSYDNGVRLTLDFLLPLLNTSAHLEFLFPSAAASSETGAQRGTLVIVPAELYRNVLCGEGLLMPARR
jgi:hypothetical protein